MNNVPTSFPHLDHFLNAYMHQDWRLFGDDLEAVLGAYAADSSGDDIRQLRSEIDDFIKIEGGRIEVDYHKLYPNSVLASGWGMGVAEWLRLVAKIAEKAAAR